MVIRMTLDKLKLGKQAIIKTVGGQGILRRRLLDMGLTPRTRVSVRKVAPMGDPIELTLRGYELTIRLDDAKNIEVAEEQHL
jgi:Fe2+ transport system protein FeoA